MVQGCLIRKKRAVACATTPSQPVIPTGPAFCQRGRAQCGALRRPGPARRSTAERQSNPYLFENKPLTQLHKTAARAEVAESTRAVRFAGDQTTPYVYKNKPLRPRKTPAAQTTPTAQTRCRIIPHLPIIAHLRFAPPTLISRTPSRQLFHNWGICHSIRVSDINGRISNSRHINGSGRSSLILWSWPPSCNPH